MFTLVKSEVFDRWLDGLKDRRAIARITARIRSFELGNLGDCKPIRGGVWELRVHYGAGYRIYYTQQGRLTYFLLIGGLKSAQQRDIEAALAMANEITKESRP